MKVFPYMAVTRQWPASQGFCDSSHGHSFWILLMHQPVMILPSFPQRFLLCACLQVEALWHPLLLLVKNLLLGLAEIGLHNLHTALAESKETRLCANGLDVGSRQILLGHDQSSGARQKKQKSASFDSARMDDVNTRLHHSTHQSNECITATITSSPKPECTR